MRALIVVDVQNDFCEGGSLAVKGGAEVADKITEYLDAHADQYAVIVASKDYHQANSTNGGHFAEKNSDPNYSSTWPAHCVQDTPGSQFHPDLHLPTATEVVYKGSGHPAYSAFEGSTQDGDTLDAILLAYRVRKIDVVGIATDYCVKATALDGSKRGYNTTVLLDLTAAVGGEEGRSQTAEELAGDGVWVLNTDNIDWKVGLDG